MQIGQFAIVDHEPVERGPNAGMFHGRGALDERSELIMVAEGTTPAAEGFAGHVVSAVGHVWADLDLSLTGALKRVVDEAERNVRDWNDKSIAQHQVALGVTCLARRGDHAVIAQSGPSIAFYASAEGVRVLAPEQAASPPIGENAAPVETTLSRAPLEPGDRLLIVSTAALTVLDEALIADILRLPAEQVLPELYQRLRDLRHVTVVLLTTPQSTTTTARPRDHTEAPGPDEQPNTGEPLIGGADQISLRELQRVPAGLFQPSLFIDGGDEESHLQQARKRIGLVNLESRRVQAPPREEPLQMKPLRKASGDDTLRRIASEHSTTAAVSRSRAGVAMEAAKTARKSHDQWRNPPPPATPTEAVARPVSRNGNGNGNGNHIDGNGNGSALPPAASNGDGPPRDGRVVTRNHSFSRGLAAGTRRTRPPEHAVSEAPLVSELADGRRAEAAHYQAASGTLADMIAADSTPTPENAGPLVRPRASMGGRWKSNGGRRQVGGAHGPPTWLVILVGLGVLMAVLGVLVVPGMLGEQDGEREARLVGTAQELFSNAEVQQDPAMRRESLNEAHGLLLEAQQLDPDDTAVAGLLEQVSGALAAMNAVVTPSGVEPIASLAQIGETPLAVTKLTVSDTEAYVLDAAAKHVLVTDFASGSTQIVFDATTGEFPAPVAVDYAEMVELGSGRLLIADESAGLWSYRPLGTVEPLEFAAPGGVTITDIAVHENSLYVLDAAHGVILQFPASDGGFATEPIIALDSSELAGARHLMVDGDFITVDIDGAVHRFSGEIALQMSQSGIDRPLAAAKSANAFGANGEIAIADPSADRVVVLNRDGTFARQYRHEDFQRITALAMRDGVGYAIAGGELRRVNW